MLMLLAPVAVGLLSVTARAVKQWKTGSEIKNKDTAVIQALVLEEEWEVLETSDNSKDMRAVLFKGIERHALAEQALGKEGIQ